ncbi:hypothetical protein [uncultured Hoeflea sp.]|uniref:hypothetical protein n=1 Tax=uncultured Hoeflea sp. TaxID=538666 RepID=UPI0030EF1415|tara:strand:- start:42061 stop:42762 length:702 start_codon:yes stop_codon:yes gene_type:complete
MGLQKIASRIKHFVLRTLRWLLAIPRWLLKEWLPIWLGLLIPYATFLGLGWLGGDREATIRLTGMLLQLAGFTTVILSLDGRWKAFKRSGLLDSIRLRFSRFPKWKEKNVIVAAGVGSLAAIGGDARVFVESGERATNEQRLSRIEDNLKSLHKEVGALDRSTKERFNEFNTKLDAEARERLQSDERLLTKLSDALTQGIHIEGLGVWFFIIGVILSTASKEISSLGMCQIPT